MKHAFIKICGIVQGVGFRPFIHRHAEKFGLKGYIINTSSGVELELEGEEEALKSFADTLPAEAPALALIESLECTVSDGIRGYTDFEIRKSKTEITRNTLISPDIAICPNCLRELRSPTDRRYRYPFINCTDCGPRFTIIKDVPYDRAKTSMGSFIMCPECESEYTDIRNRRYHAQPDCCPDCGPDVFFLDDNGGRMPGDAIENARRLIKNGGIAAVKGLGGIHLACRCDDPEIAQTLRRRKQRDEKPFAVMCRDIQSARELCEITADEEKLLCGSKRPIVLLKKKTDALSHLSENGYLGIMLPYTPLHYLLMGEDIKSLVMTSANLSDTPIMFRNAEALEKLRGIADGYLLHNRDIVSRCDDSLCYVLDGREYPLRRSRGYVPFPVRLEIQAGSALGCGAEQKASFCLLKDGYAFPSQHIGDLKNYETFENYEQQIAHFENLFDIKPQIIACDLHPDYMSSLYAEKLSRELDIPLVRVQHHHAHMLSCMADNKLHGKTIGLIWDGTGLGTDGSIWGAECLVGDEKSFERFGSIRKIKLPGGDRATKELERIAYSLLRDSGCDTSAIKNAESYEMLIKSGLNCPEASSMGRLFDGAAAILGIKSLAGYEGQAAVLLEAAASKAETDGHYTVRFEDGGYVFDWGYMIREMAAEKASGADINLCAAKFINTLIETAVIQAEAASKAYGIKNTVLSGGTFQNMYIMSRLPGRLRARGLEAWHHSRVSCNDEGISLGQIIYAMAVKNDVSGSTAETD